MEVPVKLFLILTLILGTSGCFKQKATATTVTPVAKEAVEETVKAVSIDENEAGRSGKSIQGSSVSTASLKKLSEDLFRLDSNSVGSRVTINAQGKTKSNDARDHAPNPLFSQIGGNVLTGSTFQKLDDLLDNYNPLVTSDEQDTAQEGREQEAFLTEVMKTELMKKLEQFLKQNRLITGTLKNSLKSIWFSPYSRARGRSGAVVGSSGFEHVFAGEIKNGKVSGFHNWVFFMREEQDSAIDYMGHMREIDLGTKADVLKMKFTWNDKEKNVGSMFIGTSPELEMALYTLCFYTRPNKGCNLKMNGKTIRIKVYTQKYKGKTLIGSAYPDIY